MSLLVDSKLLVVAFVTFTTFYFVFRFLVALGSCVLTIVLLSLPFTLLLRPNINATAFQVNTIPDTEVTCVKRLSLGKALADHVFQTDSGQLLEPLLARNGADQVAYDSHRGCDMPRRSF